MGPGSEYPFANMPTGTGAIAAVSKWGQKVRLTDEEIARSVYAGQSVDRSLRKTVNSIIKQVDGVTISAITSAVTTTQAAAVVWSGVSPTIMRDILLAKAKVVNQNLGYLPDTLLLDDNHYALAMSDTNITNALRRENTDNPIYTGQIEVILGLTIVVSPNIGGFQTAGQPYVLDSTQLGGMANELAVQVKSIRQDTKDCWDLQGRRKTVPIVQEPAAACQITIA